MWKLTNVWKNGVRNETGGCYVLKKSESYVFGRKNCDIELAGDNSISRLHAVIRVGSDNKVTITDSSSKYGTTVNDNKVEKDPVELKDGDSIKFGILGNVWSLSYGPLVVTTSSLDTANKQKVKDAIKSLGGQVVNDWTEECAYVVMTKILVTSKVICSLVKLCPIVKPEFLEALNDAVRGKKKIPDSASFLPPVAEQTLKGKAEAFKPNSARQDLFKGLRFISYSKRQFDRLSQSVCVSGGEILIGQDHSLKDRDFLQKNVRVLQLPPDLNTQSLVDGVPDIVSFLNRNGRRIIMESEISLAVVHVSTEKYCNPDVDMTGSQIFSVGSSQVSEVSQLVLAPDTEDPGEGPSSRTPRVTSGKLVVEETASEKSLEFSVFKQPQNSTGQLQFTRSRVAETAFSSVQSGLVQNEKKRLTRSTDSEQDKESPPRKQAKTTGEASWTGSKKDAATVESRERDFDDEPMDEDEDLFSFGARKPPPKRRSIFQEEQKKKTATKRTNPPPPDPIITEPVKRLRLDEPSTSSGRENNNATVSPIVASRDGFMRKPSLKEEDMAQDVVKAEPKSDDEMERDDFEVPPEGLVRIEYIDIRITATNVRPVAAAEQEGSSGLNFKRFQKIPYKGYGRLPEIIGGSDFETEISRCDVPDNAEFDRQPVRTKNGRSQENERDLFNF